jgi:hypothetical protein
VGVKGAVSSPSRTHRRHPRKWVLLKCALPLTPRVSLGAPAGSEAINVPGDQPFNRRVKSLPTVILIARLMSGRKRPSTCSTFVSRVTA